MKTLYLLERYLSPRPALVRGQGQPTLPICERGRSRVQRTETCGALPKSSVGTSSVRNQPKALSFSLLETVRSRLWYLSYGFKS
jgi:hypothetical protein